MHRAAVMNDHGARGNWPHGRSLRIESFVTFDGVGLLAAAMQAMRQHAQQMRSRYVGHGAIVERAFRDCDPNAQLVVVEAWFTERLILMPRRRVAPVTGLEYRVI